MSDKMVSVPVERLREIEWTKHLCCPVCGGMGPYNPGIQYAFPEEVGHYPDCWLADALKEADDEGRG